MCLGKLHLFHGQYDRKEDLSPNKQYQNVMDAIYHWYGCILYHFISPFCNVMEEKKGIEIN
jgi:hypothetical protein